MSRRMHLGVALPEGAGLEGHRGPLLAAVDRWAGDGRYPDLFPIWCTWGDPTAGPPGSAFPPFGVLDGLVARGITPVIYWQPMNGAQRHGAVMEGLWDAYIADWATQAARWGQPLIVRFAHEQNGHWFAWSPRQNGNTARSYAAMWRKVSYRVRVIAPNVRMWWCPNVGGNKLALATYPGDRWVDYVGLDGYRYPRSRRGMGATFKRSIASIREVTQKPLIIGETGVAATFADQARARWITTGYADMATLGVHGIIYFDLDLMAREGVDWSLTPALRKVYDVTAHLYGVPR